MSEYKVTTDFGPSWQHKNRTNLDNIVLDYLIEKLFIKSFVDIGCGPGGQVEVALQRGLEALGVEGDPALDIYKKEYISHHDYTSGEFKIKQYDLGWSMEFLEHVMEKYISNIFSTFISCRYIFCTHAVPRQGGRHHVNCQTDKYWVEVFKSYGFSYDEKFSKELRKMSESRWTRGSGMFFIREVSH